MAAHELLSMLCILSYHIMIPPTKDLAMSCTAVYNFYSYL